LSNTKKNNDEKIVKKLQRFLKEYENFKEVEETGNYDKTTYNAVIKFQEKYSEDILKPWSIEKGTGYVYLTTSKKINNLYCEKAAEREKIAICPFVYEKLKVGDIHPEVERLGKFLQDRGFLPKTYAVSNYYDTFLLNAVTNFSKKYGEIIQPLLKYRKQL